LKQNEGTTDSDTVTLREWSMTEVAVCSGDFEIEGPKEKSAIAGALLHFTVIVIGVFGGWLVGGRYSPSDADDSW